MKTKVSAINFISLLIQEDSNLINFQLAWTAIACSIHSGYFSSSGYGKLLLYIVKVRGNFAPLGMWSYKFN
jgi:hypothetical protein